MFNTAIMQIEMMMINTNDGKTVPTQELLEKTSRILHETLHLHFATVQVLLFDNREDEDYKDEDIMLR